MMIKNSYFLIFVCIASVVIVHSKKDEYYCSCYCCPNENKDYGYCNPYPGHFVGDTQWPTSDSLPSHCDAMICWNLICPKQYPGECTQFQAFTMGLCFFPNHTESENYYDGFLQMKKMQAEIVPLSNQSSEYVFPSVINTTDPVALLRLYIDDWSW